MASIFKDMHFNSSSLFSSNFLSSMNSLEIFKSPPVQAPFSFQKINMHTLRHIFDNFPKIIQRRWEGLFEDQLFTFFSKSETISLSSAFTILNSKLLKKRIKKNLEFSVSNNYMSVETDNIFLYSWQSSCTSHTPPKKSMVWI